MPGSGKSTVGRHLAKQLGRRFVDSDVEVERRLGMPIREWFTQHGEESFRDVEQQVIDDLTREGDVVLATGGGAVLRQANRDALHERTHCFYLRSTPEEIFRRLRHEPPWRRRCSPRSPPAARATWPGRADSPSSS